MYHNFSSQREVFAYRRRKSCWHVCVFIVLLMLFVHEKNVFFFSSKYVNFVDFLSADFSQTSLLAYSLLFSYFNHAELNTHTHTRPDVETSTGMLINDICIPNIMNISKRNVCVCISVCVCVCMALVSVRRYTTFFFTFARCFFHFIFGNSHFLSIPS